MPPETPIHYRTAARVILAEVDSWVGEAQSDADRVRRQTVRDLVQQRVDQCDYELDLPAEYADLMLPNMSEPRTSGPNSRPGFTFWVRREGGVLPIPQPQVRMPSGNVSAEKPKIEADIKRLNAIPGDLDAAHMTLMQDACTAILAKADQENVSVRIDLYLQLAGSVNAVALRNPAKNGFPFAGEIFATQLEGRANDLQAAVQKGDITLNATDSYKLKRLFSVMKEPIAKFRPEATGT